MKKAEKVMDSMIILLYLILGTVGMTQAYLSVIRPGLRQTDFYVAVILTCVSVLLVYELKIFKNTTLPVLAALLLYLAAVWQSWDKIIGGLNNGMLDTVVRINHHFGVNLVLRPRGGIGSLEITYSMFMILLPLMVLLGYGIVRLHAWLTAFLLALPLLLSLWTVDFPSMMSLLCMAVCWLGILSGRGKRRKGRVFFGTSAVSLVLCLVSALIAYYGVKPYVDRFYNERMELGKNIQDAIGEEVLPELFTLTSRQTGLGSNTMNGELDREGGFSYTGARMLEVTVQEKPSADIYLKGYIGNLYTGAAWEADGDEPMRAYYQSRGWELPGQFSDTVNLSYHAAEAVYDKFEKFGAKVRNKPVQIQVDRIAASRKYQLYPYGALLPAEAAVSADGSIAGGSKSSAYLYYPVDEYSWGNYDGFLELGEYDQAEERYRSYVYDNYMEYPAEQLPELTDYCDNFWMYDIYEKVTMVSSLLGQLAEYNINAGTCPEGKEFTEYFLFEQKEGYCVHFATAAVLMLRYFDVPARYVSGYYVPASSFEKKEDGSFVALVEDRQAHAWAEVYIDKIGWVPVETTPGGVSLTRYQTQQGGDGQIAASGVQQGFDRDVRQPGMNTEEGEGRRPQEDAGEKPSGQERQENTEAGENGLGGRTESGDTNSISGGGVMAVLILTMLIILLTILVRGMLLRSLRRRKLERADSNERIQYLFHCIYDVFLYAGFPRDFDPASSEFAQRAAEYFEWLDQEAFSDFMESVIRSNFGEAQLTEEKVFHAGVSCGKIYRQLYKGLSPLKRLWFRLWKDWGVFPQYGKNKPKNASEQPFDGGTEF